MKYKISLALIVSMLLIVCICVLNFYVFPNTKSQFEKTLMLIIIEIALITFCTMSKDPFEFISSTVIGIPILTVLFSEWWLNGLLVGIGLMTCIILITILLRKTMISFRVKPVDPVIVDKIIYNSEIQQRKFEISKIKFHGEHDE